MQPLCGVFNVFGNMFSDLQNCSASSFLSKTMFSQPYPISYRLHFETILHCETPSRSSTNRAAHFFDAIAGK